MVDLLFASRSVHRSRLFKVKLSCTVNPIISKIKGNFVLSIHCNIYVFRNWKDQSLLFIKALKVTHGETSFVPEFALICAVWFACCDYTGRCSK